MIVTPYRSIMKRLLLPVLLLFCLPVTAQQSPSASSLELPADPAMEGSVYDLESTWRDQRGREFPIADLKGKVRVVAMGYTSCQYACPRIIADLKRVEMELQGREADTDYLSISFISIDPETDTPKRLKKLEADYRFDPKRWLLLTGDDDGVLELAVALGMKYRKTTALDFAHSNIITVLAPDGRILYQSSAIGEDISKMVNEIRQAVAAMEEKG